MAHRRTGSMPTIARLAAAGLMLVALVGVAASASQAPQARAADDPVTPIIATEVPQKAVTAVRGSDRRYHVMYELVLTNTVAKPSSLRSVHILDAATGRRLRTLTARDMVAGGALHQLDREPVTSTVFPQGQARVLFLTASFASRKAVPRTLEHRFELSSTNPFTERAQRFGYVAAPVTLSRRVPPVLSPPLDGGAWLASDGCCTPSGHVAAMFGLDGRLQAAERYAIDWIHIDATGRIYNGDPAVLSNWSGYGARVKAMSAGVVTVASDGQPDQVPGVKPSGLPFEKLPGNYVVIRQPGGLSGVYAHFKPGSVAVKVGDRVRAGDHLGLLGNSGGSLAPHLHFHVVDGTSAATSDGYPYTLSSFQLAGKAGVDDLLAALQGRAGFPSRDQLRPVGRTRELPLGFTIVDFP